MNTCHKSPLSLQLMFVRADWRGRLALAGVLLVTAGGCTDGGITAPRMLEPDLAKNGPKDRPASEFVVTDLGFPPWATAAGAYAVNDAGQAVGWSAMQGQDWRGFVWAGDWLALSETGVNSQGRAISNGNTVYVGGDLEHEGTSRPARWTVSTSGGAPTISSVEILDYSAYGIVRGLNNHGTAVGISACIIGCLGRATIWPLAGSPTVVDPPPAGGFTRGTGRDINDAGLVVLVFEHPDYSRAYLRLTDGTLVELPPRPGDVSSFVGGISEVGPDGTVFIAGTTFRSDSDFHPVRWRVHALSGAILSTELMSENGSVGSTSATGELAGAIEKRYSDNAAVWPGASAVQLPRPKGASSSIAWSISSSGQVVAGQVTAKQTTGAILWSRAR